MVQTCAGKNVCITAYISSKALDCHRLQDYCFALSLIELVFWFHSSILPESWGSEDSLLGRLQRVFFCQRRGIYGQGNKTSWEKVYGPVLFCLNGCWLLWRFL